VGRSSRAVAAVLAIAFLALHLPYTAPSLEDIDSINFALGIRDFDVAEHQPHPPGYPVFILIAKAVNAVSQSEVLTLSLLGIASGALLAFVLTALFGALTDAAGEAADGDLKREGDAKRVALHGWVPAAAAALALVTPLTWITAARPLSDVPGLVVALFVQWLLIRAPTVRAIAVAAFAAGFAAGVRSQVVWLTVPLLVVIAITNRRAWRLDSAMSIAGAYVAGVLIWAVPLLIVSGGPSRYWNAVAFQGGADLSGVTMLWTNPTPRQAAAAFAYGFLHPWGWWPLAAVVLSCAIGGAVWLLVKSPRVALVLAAAFGPYLVFDILFQETVTTRYALPLVVPVALLASVGLAAMSPRWGAWAAAALAGIALAVGHPTLVAYASEDAPAFRMLADMRAETRNPSDRPMLGVHRRQDFDLRRPMTWMGHDAPAFSGRLAAPPRLEWLELVNYWNNGGRQTTWFVADPLRSDLALVHHRALRASYRWPLRFRELIGGVRPSEMDWYALDAPAWYLGEGWSLTPEAAGLAAATGKGPASGGSHGWIRRSAGPLTLMLGGRLLPGGGDRARLSIAIDGRVVASPEVGPGFFLQMFDLPAGSAAGQGDYAALVITADNAGVALEQFDAQPAGTVVFGFGEGWHEREYDPSTGQLWRWSSDRSAVRVRAEGKALSMRIRGVSEAGRTVNLTVRAGDTVVVTEAVGPAFVVDATIPAAALAPGESVITVESDGSFVPAEVRWRTQDRRRLGLKIFECGLTPAS
jgi:hypothetical protein